MSEAERLARIEVELATIKGLLLRVVNPAANLSVEEKAGAIRKALKTGDKAVLRQTMREINGI